MLILVPYSDFPHTILYAVGQKRDKEFYGRSVRGYCARTVDVILNIKAFFYTTFYAQKKKEKTDFFLTPTVWTQIAAQSVSLLIDTLYIQGYISKDIISWIYILFEDI